jgi:cytochrome c oxidase cbb3-type subunit I/II
MVAETKRYGEYSKPGEFIYDRPFQWGSRRIGPDLAREGGKQSSFWHWTHFENPALVSEGSVMPSYEHLLEQDLKFSAIPPMVNTAHMLGAPYSEQELENSEELARQQAEVVAAEIVSQGGPPQTYEKQAIALIAYLQRVGVDYFKTEEPADTESPGDVPAGGVDGEALAEEAAEEPVEEQDSLAMSKAASP